MRRRELITAGLVGLPLAYGLARFDLETHAYAPGLLLAAIGVKPAGSLPFRGNVLATSVLTLIEPMSGTWRTLEVPIPEAHSLVDCDQRTAVIGNSNAIAMLDDQHNVQHRISAPAGWDFAGHGVWLPHQRHLLVGLRPSREQDRVEDGQLAIIDPATGRIIGTTPSGGYDPHDMIMLRDGRVAVANYGDKHRADLLDYQALESKLTLLDAASLAILKTIVAPRIGALSHICEGPDGVIAGLPARLQTLTEDALTNVKALTQGASVDLSAVEVIEGKIGAPSPMLTLNLNGGDWQSYLPEPAKQRRPQSLAYHRGSEAWLATYPYSDYVARLAKDGQMQMVSVFDLGISYPRGVCVLPGDRHAFVAGQFRGLAKVDAVTLKLVARFDVPTYDATHILPMRRSKGTSV